MIPLIDPKFLKDLQSGKAASNTTSLITFHLPGKMDLGALRATLKREAMTSKNIKDRSHGKAVRRSLTQCTELVRSLNKLPHTGLALFAGQWI